MYNPVLSMYARVSISYKHCMSGIYYPRTSTQGRISMDSLVSVANGHPWIIPGQVQYYPTPPFRVSTDALVCRAIHGSSPDKCNTPTPPFRVSADALVCRAIHGSSPDKCNTPPPLQSIRGCPSMSGHPWIIPGQVQYPHPPFQSIHGCPSMSGHPWIIPGQVQYPPSPFRVSADALVCPPPPLSEYPRMP